jgi:hypothetical protein
MDVGEVYKIRPGYTCFVGCNIYDAGKVITVTDSNFDIIKGQLHKLEIHEPVVVPEKVTEEKPKPKRNVKDKMTRTIRSK